MIDADLIKLLGEGSVTQADQLVATSSEILHISPSIDIGLNGGIPGGTVVVLTGKPKVGKTTLALSIIAEAQRTGRPAFYAKVEGRLQEMNLNGIPGLQRDQLQIISSYKDADGKIVQLTAEQYLDASIAILRNHPRCILVVDSIARLCPEGEMQQSMSDSGRRASVPSLLSKFFNQVCQLLPIQDSILILITHVMANPSGMGKATTEKGGFAQAYGADIKLEALYTEKVDDGAGEDKKIVGQICHWQVLHSALGAPFQKIKMHLRYGHGIDKIAELIELGIMYGFISGKGSWYTVNFVQNHLDKINKTSESKEYKFQGLKKLYVFFEANPKLCDALYKELLSMLCPTP